MHFAVCCLLALVVISTALPNQKLKFSPSQNLKEKLAGHLGRIVGGGDAGRDEFPYIVSYQWDVEGQRQPICGGSILNERWVLTAAHCILDVPPIGDFYVVAGVLDPNEQVATRQEIKVVNKITHPQYVAGAPGPYDIAVVQLESPLELNAAVQKITLPEIGSVPSGTGTFYGWGAVTPEGHMPKNLQRVEMPILTYQECADAVAALLEGEIEPLHESNVCTGPLTGGISACGGDTGSPLVVNNVLVGIFSWGWNPCGFKGCPSVHTGISNYIEWINENMS